MVSDSFRQRNPANPSTLRAIKRVIQPRSPTTSDLNYELGTEWLDSSSDDFYKLASKALSVATWVLIGGTGGAAEEFIVSSGTSPVVPNASNQITLTDGNGVGMTGGTNAITFDMVSPFIGNFTFTTSISATTETIAISNNDNTAAANSGSTLAITVAGTTQIGDPYIQFGTGNARAFSVGTDTSDSQIFKINTDNAASVSPSSGDNLFLLNSSGDVSFNTLSLGHFPPEIDLSFTINGGAINALLSIDAEGATDLGDLIGHRYSDIAAFGGYFIQLRSRGTAAAPTIVQSGDVIGRLLSAGYDGTDYAQSAEIRAEVDGTPGSDDMPGRWVFLVSPDGSQTPAEAMRISNNKQIDINGLFQNTLSASGQWFSFKDGTDTFGYYNNAGSPEGVVTASIGSWCSDTTNGQIYVKNTGDATNTGWLRLDSSAAPDFSWTEITTSPGPTAMTADNGYIANNAVGSVGLTLPSSISQGSIIRVAGKGAGGFDIQQNAGQTIHFAGSNTTTGAGGSVTSTIQYNTIELLCITTDTDFEVLSSVGSFTIV